MRRNLRDRALIRPPQRFQESSSDEEQVDELANEISSLNSEPNSVGTSESENILALEQELDRATLDDLSFSSLEDLETSNSSDSNSIQAPKMATVFELDPYAGNINPADTDGRKLFLAATKERDDDKKFTVKQDNAKVFMDAMLHDSSKFGWESLVHSVPVGANDETLSILRDIRKLKLDFVLREAKKTWADTATVYNSAVPKESADFVVEDIDPGNDQDDEATFYRRVCLKMIWLRLLGSLSTASENALMAKKHLFCWQKPSGDYEYDGPTALFLVLESVNPSTRVGVARLKKKLRDTRLGGYNHNV